MEKQKKSIGCLGIVGIIFAVGFVGSLFDGDSSETSTSATPSSVTATSDAAGSSATFQSAGCLVVSPSLVDSIAQGLNNAKATGKAAGFRSSDFADVKFVAVEFIPNGLSEKEVAVFGTNDDNLSDASLDGLILAADGFAKQFSSWGESSSIELSIADDGAKESVECLSLPGFKMGGLNAEESGFDQQEFLRVAKSKYGVVDETYEDGSTLRVMDLAQRICEGNVSEMKKNLGNDWESSFNKFTIETICPQKLN